MCACFSLCLCVSKRQKDGVMRESNSRPPAPKAGIIPLDQSPTSELPTSVRGLVVMIVACQVMDPGSIPGERIFLCRRPADRTKKKTTVAPGGTRTPNPQIRSLMRYPLRHRGLSGCKRKRQQWDLNPRGQSPST